VLVIGDNNPLRHIRRPWVNHALIVLCLAGFVLGLSVGHFALLPAEISGLGAVPEDWDGLHWSLRLLSYTFLHADIWHLLGNLIILWVFGDNVEDAMGHVRYAIFFGLCAIGGGLAEALFTASPELPIVGASGAIAGVMAAYLMMHPRARILILAALRFPVIAPASLFVGLSIGFDVLMALFADDTEQVAWWAHIGGFATGMVLLLPFKHRDVALFQPADAYPVECFGGAHRFLLDLSPKTKIGARFSDRAVAAFKIVAFFFLITVLAEVVFT
jgi:membrane associated rhomboid family serine protease